MHQHAGRTREWLALTAEGTCLIDIVGIAEALSLDAVEVRREPRSAVVAALDRGLESCPHGLRLWADLSAGQPATPRAGALRDLDLLCGLVMGSGTAPWTRGGLAAIDRCRPRGQVVADVGAGSGVLGLHALQLGAARVDAFDVDELAIAVARRNARVNGMAERYRARLGSVEAMDPPYDLVVYSLPDRDMTETLLGRGIAALSPGGWLVLAPLGGPEERAAMKTRVRHLGCEPVEIVDVEGWETLIARREGGL